MDRIEIVRTYVDNVLANRPDAEERRCGYLHLYGVAQACAMLAMKRGENVELAVIAGMLHDISTYSTGDSTDHAQRGAVMAGEILRSLDRFTDEEIDLICGAIRNHSCKGETHSAFDEVLIDADVMQHYFYNPLLDGIEKEKARGEKLKKEFGIL